MKTGVRGLAYVRTSRTHGWPAELASEAAAMSDAVSRSTASRTVMARLSRSMAVDARRSRRLHGRPDRPRWRRQVDAARSSRAGVTRIQTGMSHVLGGRYGAIGFAAPRHRRPHRLHAAGPRPQSLSDAERGGEPRFLRPAVRPGCAASAGPASTTCSMATGLAALSRPASRQALRRHEAEARHLRRAHPRSRPADPRRADHRHRSAVAAAVLGARSTRCARAGRR